MAITYLTFEELINKVVRQLRMVTGTSIQTYSEDIIAEHLQSAFDEYFEAYFWKEYSSWQTYTLDGTVGIPNADIDSTLSRIQDIGKMFVGGTDTQVPLFPQSLNPNLITGSVPRYYEQYITDRNRVFRVLPAASTGTVVCYVRTKPTASFIDSDTIYMDSELLVMKACWIHSETDGANPGQIKMFQKRADDRFETLISSITNSTPVVINTGIANGNQFTQWS